jgi:flagellar hook assembly protein FlgD
LNSQSAGLQQINWDGKDNDGNLVARYFYDVNIQANNGSPSDSWESSDGGNSSYYVTSSGKTGVYPTGFSPYKNIPVRIDCDMLDWAVRQVDVIDSDSSSQIKCIANRMLKPGWNSFEWYGYGNDGKLCKQKYNVYFHLPSIVNKGSVLVYYNDMITNLRCNPYRIIALNDEASVISYTLACSSKVTIKIYDPEGIPFTLMDKKQQNAGRQEVILHGTSDPLKSNGMYLSKEGIYRIEVKIENSNLNESKEGSITVYR